LRAESFVCPEPVKAYDPVEPKKLIGQFEKGSVLEIDPIAPTPGYHKVKFVTPTHQTVVALCVDDDIGKAPVKPVRVLFLGDNFTLMHQIPLQVRQLAIEAKEKHPFETEMIARDGATLKQLLDDADANKKIKEGKWNFVVVQAGSEEMLNGGDALLPTLQAFDTLIHHVAGSRMMLFMTWADKTLPQKQTVIKQRYRGLGTELKAWVAPVGVGWEKAATGKQSVDLYNGDGHNANAAGSYLAACVFYSLFYAKSPEGLPYDLKNPDVPTEVLNSVFPGEAKVLQTIAWDVAKNENQPKD